MIRMILLCLLVSQLIGCGSEKIHDRRSEEHQDETEVVQLELESQKLIGLEMVKVKKQALQSSINSVGEIAQETENVAHVTSPEAGTLKSFLRQLGEVVEEGTPICVIETKTGETLEIPSPSHGIILAQYLKAGDSVDNVTSIMTIADPDLLRASFNIYEKDLAGIKPGQKVIVESVAYSGKEFEGRIVFISPRVDIKTRTIKIRVNVENKEHLLKFGMFVTGKIIITSDEEVLAVPEASVATLNDTTVVFVPMSEDEFAVRSVVTGRTSGGFTEIRQGLSEGENVVTHGNFQLKSELLKDSF